jgi:hypothetical protein
MPVTYTHPETAATFVNLFNQSPFNVVENAALETLIASASIDLPGKLVVDAGCGGGRWYVTKTYQLVSRACMCM